MSRWEATWLTFNVTVFAFCICYLTYTPDVWTKVYMVVASGIWGSNIWLQIKTMGRTPPLTFGGRRQYPEHRVNRAGR